MNDRLASTLLLTKPDIAALAKVKRPVVTAWISRSRRTDRPFPDPVETAGSIDRYRAHEVVEWIRVRGLGNSDSVTEDLAMHAALGHESSLPAATVLDGLTALLCVKVQLGEQLSEFDAEDLLDEAEELDPDDEYNFREVEALGDELELLAGYVDGMADAAYTPAQAFETLMARRFRLGMRDLAESALRPAALGLAARISHALASEDAVYVDPSVDGSDLLVTLRSVLPEYEEPWALTGYSDTPSSRFARRRLAVHEWRLRPPLVGGLAEEFTVAGPATFLTQFPSPGSNTMSDTDILSAVDQIALQMTDGQSAVVVGPASALVDPLTDREAESIRSGLLRTDRVRAVLRLPEGQLLSRPGTSTAIWVLGSADPSISPSERWTVLADLVGVELNALAAEGVVADVLAAMGSWDSLKAHEFRFGVVTMTAELLPKRSLRLEHPRTAPVVQRPPWEAAGRVGELVAAVNDGSRHLDPWLSVPVEYHETGAAPTVPLGVLVTDREVKMLSGNRIDATDVQDGDRPGAVRVIGAEEVLGSRPLGSRGVDRLTLTTRYPSSRYTEPGDIVFCTASGFGVLVDAEGSSVVQFPARVLRVNDPTSSGLIPELIAHHLSATGIGDRPSGGVRRGRPWKSWRVPRIEPARVPAVAATLAELRRRRETAAELLSTIDRLTETLVDGVGRGALTVTRDTCSDPEKG